MSDPERSRKTGHVRSLVLSYVHELRPKRERELRFFQIVRTDEEALSAAALARLPNGKRHPHQYRIPRASLEESRQLLLANLPAIRDCSSFGELIEVIDRLIRPIDGIGELVVYDTALRIGARFGLEPEKVYVHRGTREGARKLGLDGRRATIETQELPAPMRSLAPREAEDFLCVYKDKL